MVLKSTETSSEVFSLFRWMPQVTIRTTFDDREEILSEYLCDWPDCPNFAVEVLGVVRELRMRAAVCAEHAALLAKRNEDSR
jgi:hypothetical protein